MHSEGCLNLHKEACVSAARVNYLELIEPFPVQSPTQTGWRIGGTHSWAMSALQL